MAATFTESQKLDYVWKKLGYGVAKTAEPTALGAANEGTASPLLYRGDLIWTQSGDIPATQPPGSITTSIVQVYADGGGAGVTAAAECTEITSAPDNQSWATGLTTWIPIQFGPDYLVRVYAGPPAAANIRATGTFLNQNGSGVDDTWFFDYQAGIVNFNGANIPTAIGTATANTIYVMGYTYVGELGVDTTFISNGTSNVRVVSSGGNVTVGVGGVGNIVVFSTAGAAITGVASASGNITGGNILTGGLISATGNVTGNYILGNGALLTGVITSVANINNGTSNVTVVSSGGNVTVGIGGTSNVAVFATTGEYITGVLSANGTVTGGNLATGGTASASGNITGGNVLTGGLVSSTGNITGGNILTGGLVSATGNVSGNYFIGNGTVITGVLADRGPDTNNYDLLTQMGVYTVNRLSWSGVTGAPTDSPVYVGLLEVKNSTNTAIEQIFYPGTVEADVKIQWNRSNWSGTWTAWIKIVNDFQSISGGTY